MSGGIQFLPPEASSLAPQVDWLFYTLLAFSGGLGLFLTALVIGYAVKYRAGSSADRSGRVARNTPLEIGWTTATLVIAFALFGWGAYIFVQRDHPPADAIEIAGLGKQWMWQFRHAGGQREIDALHIPVGRPILVTLGSQDVIHSFFVPAFRVKQDAVPGRSTRVWFTATKPGKYRLFCAEYCGTAHSQMLGTVYAMEPQDFAAWLKQEGGGQSLAGSGERLFSSLGCSGCHDGGGTVRAPNLRGVFGRPVALSNSTTVMADERYIRDSILQPNKQVAAGYDPVMPSFDGLIEESELQEVVAYIKSLSTQEGSR
ncbi:cytochrome c oxidase subunit II [Mesorhizobium sp. B2-7-3]|uniref:cytochrome c oxidase subunit II n=1 Tax=Mesorhizobium sp. B2-7-3 TaxID=2589907 RepID=UPI001127E526|nr:cytochrome c oxidase subunit II [Mesorhizobium sp. B2-7-3]TPJ14359.1 cytochrome c oxidase subunit II [Mesorhizobium sp. B2-7-3]